MGLLPDKSLVRGVYDSRARRYNQIVRLLSLGRDTKYRLAAIAELDLRSEDKVLDFGCGTGLNFPHIASCTGRETTIFGCDYSHAMLKRCSYPNSAHSVHSILCQMDNEFICFKGSGRFDKIISTYTLTTLGHLERTVCDLHSLLKHGGILVVSDDVLPPGWFLGPRIAIKSALTRRRGNLEILLDATRSRFKLEKIKYAYSGLIYICKFRKI